LWRSSRLISGIIRSITHVFLVCAALTWPLFTTIVLLWRRTLRLARVLLVIVVSVVVVLAAAVVWLFIGTVVGIATRLLFVGVALARTRLIVAILLVVLRLFLVAILATIRTRILLVHIWL
jgi:hypothetical protein